mgnify:FL=1
MHKNVNSNNFEITEEDLLFNYQESLTDKLDNYNKKFDQSILNEIILWKVNRYAEFSEDTIKLINSIDPKQDELNIELTNKVLESLLKTKGVQIAMASTILRFKNPDVYQIIDQRVFRIIYPDKQLKLNSYPSDKNINKQIDVYIKYLSDLKDVCNQLQIPFNKSDRILYKADKRINKEVKLSNY